MLCTRNFNYEPSRIRARYGVEVLSLGDPRVRREAERREAAASDLVEEVYVAELVGMALGALEKPSERAVILGRFGLAGRPSETLEEIARRRGVTRERVRQIEVRALRRIREHLAF